MFVRIKKSKNSPRKSVQIVASVRKGKNVIQKTMRYVGIAADDQELEQLKQLAETIKEKMENEARPQLFSPEEMNGLKKKTEENQKLKDLNEDYSAMECQTSNFIKVCPYQLVKIVKHMTSFLEN